MKRSFAAFFAILLIPACLFGCAPSYFVKSDAVFAGIVLDVKLYGGNPEKAYEEMVSLATEINGAISLGEPDSAINAFNESDSGKKIPVIRRVYDLVRLAKTAYAETDGAFNPCLPDVSKAWGVDNDGIATGNPPAVFPTEEELNALRAVATPDLVKTGEENGNYYISKNADGVKLDLGGIAKGYLADEFKAIAERYNVVSGCISLSGNVILIGRYKEGDSERDWGVGITDPREKHAYVCGFYTQGGVSVVTSGDYERYYFSDGIRFCHVVDPFTFTPTGVERTDSGFAQKADYVISATVRGASSSKCDALSTAVMVLGAEKGAELLERQGYDGIIFTADKKMKVVGKFDFATSQTGYTEYERI